MIYDAISLFDELCPAIDLRRAIGKAWIGFSCRSRAACIVMFPQRIAEPIIQYTDIEHQLSRRQTSLPEVAQGLRRSVPGPAKKVLLVNPLGTLAETAIASRDPSMLFLWLYALAFKSGRPGDAPGQDPIPDQPCHLCQESLRP